MQKQLVLLLPTFNSSIYYAYIDMYIYINKLESMIKNEDMANIRY